jgi:hypothetical protein
MNNLTVQKKGNAAKRNIFGGHLTVRSWSGRAIQKDFPKIRIVEAEKESDPKESSKKETQGTTEGQDVETEDAHPPTVTQDVDMENESNGNDQSTGEENQEGNSDDDKVFQLTKHSARGKSTMHQSHTMAHSLQSENKQIYMDLHLKIPTTSKDKGPTNVIAMLRKQLLKFVKDVQGAEASFKLHTSNPDAKNVMTLDTPQTLSETLVQIQNVFLNTKPIGNGGKLYMKVLVSHDCSTEAL